MAHNILSACRLHVSLYLNFTSVNSWYAKAISISSCFRYWLDVDRLHHFVLLQMEGVAFNLSKRENSADPVGYSKQVMLVDSSALGFWGFIIVQSLTVCCGFIIITLPSGKIDRPITVLSCFRYFDWLENEIKQQKALSKQWNRNK